CPYPTNRGIQARKLLGEVTRMHELFSSFTPNAIYLKEDASAPLTLGARAPQPCLASTGEDAKNLALRPSGREKSARRRGWRSSISAGMEAVGSRNLRRHHGGGEPARRSTVTSSRAAATSPAARGLLEWDGHSPALLGDLHAEPIYRIVCCPLPPHVRGTFPC